MLQTPPPGPAIAQARSRYMLQTFPLKKLAKGEWGAERPSRGCGWCAPRVRTGPSTPKALFARFQQHKQPRVARDEPATQARRQRGRRTDRTARGASARRRRRQPPAQWRRRHPAPNSSASVSGMPSRPLPGRRHAGTRRPCWMNSLLPPLRRPPGRRMGRRLAAAGATARRRQRRGPHRALPEAQDARR